MVQCPAEMCQTGSGKFIGGARATSARERTDADLGSVYSVSDILVLVSAKPPRSSVFWQCSGLPSACIDASRVYPTIVARVEAHVKDTSALPPNPASSGLVILARLSVEI